MSDNQENGLGDMVSSAAATLGITPERANVVAQAFGFKSCGCDERRLFLNRIGTRFLGLSGGRSAADQHHPEKQVDDPPRTPGREVGPVDTPATVAGERSDHAEKTTDGSSGEAGSSV